VETVDALVVGAGVVGLATARRLAMAGLETLVVERHAGPGEETSSRNSEVIHAGLYYPPGSLRARCCIAGRDFLYRYLAERGVWHRRLGKLVVATDERQHPRLRAILDNARASGAGALEWWDARRVHRVEPELAVTAALWSPASGVLDAHGLMTAYLADAEAHGAVLVPRTPLTGVTVEADRFVCRFADAAGTVLATRRLVVAAGLAAPELARRIRGLDPRQVPRQWLCKGNYFTLRGRCPFRHLVYPLPDEASLGIHVTPDRSGRCRFGPDAEWVDRVDYRVDPGHAPAFVAAIRRYWPDLPADALAPDYAGIRPKLHPPGTPRPDFRVDGPEVHGIPGLVLFFGIESPGLTASAALAEVAARRLGLPPSAEFSDLAVP